MEIFIKDLILLGVHGLTDKEKLAPQPFKVTIRTGVASINTDDDITHTADYRKMKKIAEQVIQEEHYELVESIAHRIAGLIKEDPLVTWVEVEVEKVSIWTNGRPGVRVKI